MKKLSKQEMKKVIGGDDPLNTEDNRDGGGSLWYCATRPTGTPCTFTTGPCKGATGHCSSNQYCAGAC